jgi:hypothetical protein
MISALIPTRRRREMFARTVDSIRSTQTSDVEIVAYVDNDDVATYADFRSDVKFVRGPRIVLSNTWNKCAAAARGEILLQGNDDIIFRTPGWDRVVENEFSKCPDRILMVHGSDGSGVIGSSTGGFGTHPFIHRRWMETLGYFTAPFYSSDYGDTHLNELANAIGRRRFVPIVIEHMHFWLGKGPQDETTNDRLVRHNRDNVEQLYRDLAPLREVDIEKLKARMAHEMGTADSDPARP